MELVLPMYNVHPYFSLKKVGKNVCIIHGEIQYLPGTGILGCMVWSGAGILHS